MARERYLVNQDVEDTIHTNVIVPTTAKEKTENWWFYHKKHLIIGILAAALVVYFFYSVVFQPKPDYKIALMNQIALEDSALTILENQIAKYGEDLNGDGKVLVEISNYALTSEDDAYAPQMYQALIVKFSVDISEGESMIWLHDKAGYDFMTKQVDGAFEPLDAGNTLEGDDTVIEFTNVPGLAKTDFSGYQGIGFDEELLNGVMGMLRVSIREPKNSTIERNESLMEYHAASERLFQNLLHDTPVNEEPGESSQTDGAQTDEEPQT